jgi:predicted RNase H-like nuclease (RuvC/YqgF family)
MAETPVVKEEPTTPEPSQGETKVEETKEESPKPAPGSKTESELLLKSLQEEREKRRVLEEQLEELKTSVPSEEEFSDEGKALKTQIASLETKIASIEEEKNLEKLYNQYPALRESSDKFSEFRQQEHPRAKLESVAKLFMAENGLLEPQRKGLEKSTGGTRTPPTSGMTVDDVQKLRTTDFKKYQKMLMDGQIKIG